MGKIISGILVFLAAVPLLAFQETGDVPAETRAADRLPRVYIALGVGYHFKSDQYFKQVYDSGGVNYTVDMGYWLNRKFALGIKLNYLHKTGKTLLLKSETFLRQIPLMGYLKAGFGIGRDWRWYVSGGIGYIFFKEESYIGTIKSSQFGWEIESGVEYTFKRNLYFLSAWGYQSFRKTFPGLDETQELGGIGIRVGIGVRLF
jgi:opacity protein-like surface antigen